MTCVFRWDAEILPVWTPFYGSRVRLFLIFITDLYRSEWGPLQTAGGWKGFDQENLPNPLRFQILVRKWHEVFFAFN